MKLHTKPIILALGLLALLAGCDSDPTTPNDPLPALSAADAANQSGVIAAAITQIGPKLMDPSALKAVVSYTWSGEHGLTGTVHLDYRVGVDGTPASSSEATWAHLYTDAGAPVVFTVEGLGGQTAFDLDVTANLDQMADEATILAGSGGTMTSGGYATTFTLAGIVVGSGGYPESGGMTVTAGEHTATVSFNGTNMVTMIVDSSDTWFIDLDTGEATHGVPV